MEPSASAAVGACNFLLGLVPAGISTEAVCLPGVKFGGAPSVADWLRPDSAWPPKALNAHPCQVP